MKLLLLGGTRFLGRHLVDAALARGHDVTAFTRGRSGNPWGSRVKGLLGDRDPRVAPGLAALGTGTWDAVIDTSGYVPRVVQAAVTMLASRVAHYVFVSSVSVYADVGAPGVDETAPVAVPDDPASEDVGKHYGALKAACEHAVRGAYGDRALVVRPGLIVGPHDPTDRFGYWVARFVQPTLLGDRPEAVAVPAPPSRPLQWVDARDLGEWIVHLAERGTGGTFNAISPPGLWTMRSLVDTLAAAVDVQRPVAWIEEPTLLDAKVEPWTGLPLWIPSTYGELAGFMQVDTQRAQAAGLALRPLADTVAATAAWLAVRDNAGAWVATLSGADERALLAGIQ